MNLCQCAIMIGGEQGYGRRYNFLVSTSLSEEPLLGAAKRCTDLADKLYNKWAETAGYTLNNFLVKGYHSEAEALYQYQSKRAANYVCETRKVTLEVETICGIQLHKFSRYSGGRWSTIYLINLIKDES